MIDFPLDKKYKQGSCEICFIGIEKHKPYSQMTVLDGKGQEIKTGRIANRRQEMETFLEEIREDAEAILEAGRACYVMSDLNKEMGVGVKKSPSTASEGHRQGTDQKRQAGLSDPGASVTQRDDP